MREPDADPVSNEVLAWRVQEVERNVSGKADHADMERLLVEVRGLRKTLTAFLVSIASAFVLSSVGILFAAIATKAHA